MFKKVIFNTGSQIIGKIATATVSLLVAILIGRTLSEAGYGEFTKIMVFVGYFYTLADFGLNTIYIKLVKDDAIDLLKSLVGLRIVIALALMVIAIVSGNILPYDEATKTGFNSTVKAGIAIASLTILTQALATSANGYFQKKLRYDLSTIAALVSATTILLSTFVVITTNGNIFGFVSAYVLGGIVFVVVIFLLLLIKTKQMVIPNFNLKNFHTLASRSWPVGLALIINIIYFRIDVFILSNFRASGEVGIYGLAYQFFEASLSVPIFFSNALYPLLQGLFQSDRKQFKKEIKRWLIILTMVGILATGALMAISSSIPILFNGRFADSVVALRILSVGMPFFFISALLWHMIIIYGKQKYLIAIYGTGAVFNLLLNAILIPRYGYIAAASTTVVSEGLIATLLAFVILKNRLHTYP